MRAWVADETPLSICQRHVVEGKARIARHEHMIERLSRTGQTQMTQHAVSFLVSLLENQRGCEDRLASELSKLPAGG